MDFGIWLPARVDCWPVVRRGEELGFTDVHLYDSHMMYADTFMVAALCAEHTERIRVGQGVTNPLSRTAPLMAGCLTTLNQLAPGRAFLGIGTGYSTQRAMGLPPATVRQFATYVRIVKELIRGGVAEYREEGRDRIVRLIHGPDSLDPTFVNCTDPIPVYVAAKGPKAMAVAGEFGDGLILSGTRPTADDIGAAWRDLAVGAARAERSLKNFPIIVKTRVYITERGEKFGNDRMKRMVFGEQSTIGCYSAGIRPGILQSDFGERLRDDDIPVAWRALAMENRRLIDRANPGSSLADETWYLRAFDGHGWRLRPELLDLISDDLLRSSALIGTADAVLKEIRSWEAMGVTAVGPMCSDSIELTEAMLEQFGEHVIGRY